MRSYVAPITLRRFAADAALAPAPPAAPSSEHLEAAVLCADISGFTTLAEALARRGPEGAEVLTQLLNDYLGQLVELVAAHGGEVLNFAGDAVIAIWACAPGGDNGGCGCENLSLRTWRAAFCALDIQAQLNNYQTPEGVQLLLRLGISAGEVQALHVGGVGGRWKFLLAGEPLAQMGQAQSLAEPGEVVLDYAALQHLGAQSGSPRTDGLNLGYQRLHEIEAPPPLPPPPLPPAPPAAEDAAVAAARPYVSQAVLSRLDAEQPDWLAELRRVSVLFVNIKGLNYNSAQSLEQVQAAVSSVQQTLAHLEGAISQLVADSNGTVLIAAFGQPPRTHQDDPQRAVQAALEIQARLRQQGLLSSIGITTGRVFCGPIGNQRRREYTMVGSVINLSARLMQIGSNQILCDSVTQQAARSRLAFEALPAVAAKGVPHPVPIFRPLPQLEGASASAPSAPSEQAPPVGRLEERAILARALDALGEGASSVVLLEGEPGIGKSRLVEELLRLAAGSERNRLAGAASAIEQATPYHAWRSILIQVLGLGGIAEVSARREQALKYLQAHPDLAAPEVLRLAPLLNEVLPLDFSESDLTSQMAGRVRADNTRGLLRRILQAHASKQATVLVLEDAHWLDSASWALARLVQEQVQPLLLVIATRPLPEPIPDEYKYLARAPACRRMVLEALPAGDSLGLVCRRLGVTELAGSVADLIQQKAQGNPFFTEELAYSLRESGLILIQDGACRLAPGVNLSSVMFPDSVQGVVTERIDRLNQHQQITLKAASVIGRVFRYSILRDIDPGHAEPRLAEDLEGLQQLDITPLDTPEPNLAYIFKHAITQEVSYNLMLFAQRRELHQAVALWHERAHSADLAPYFSLLAYHWKHAENAAKALEYAEKAGEQALRSAAYQEAVGYFEQVLALDEAQNPPRSGDGARSLKRAGWERKFAEALIGVGRLLESRQHLEQAVSLLGFAVPKASRALALAINRQVLRQVGNRVNPGRYKRSSQAEKDVALEAARCFERLAQSYFHDNQMALTLFCSLRALNLAEAFGASPELARAYVNAGLSAGLVPLRRLSGFYDRRAAEVAADAGQLRAATWVKGVSGLGRMNVGELEEAASLLQQAVGMAEELGDRRQWVECMGMLCLSSFYAGHFTLSAGQAADLSSMAARSGDVQAQVWGQAFHAMNLLALDDTSQASTMIEGANRLLAESLDASLGRQEQMEVLGPLSIVRLRQARPEQARQAADEMLRLMIESPLTAAAVLVGYSAAAEVFQALLAQNPADSDASLKQQARRAVSSLGRFARVFPLGQPRAWLMRGSLHWLSGKSRLALRAWRRSLALAQRLGLRYDQGLAHLEIGRHLQHDDAARAQHLEGARDIFAELGAVYDLKQAQAALGEGE